MEEVNVKRCLYEIKSEQGQNMSLRSKEWTRSKDGSIKIIIEEVVKRCWYEVKCKVRSKDVSTVLR